MRHRTRTLLYLVTAFVVVGWLPASTADSPQPWVGVMLEDAVDGGARVVALVPGGPAARAGMRVGDLIVDLDDQAVADRAALSVALDLRAPGDTVRFVVMRDGAAHPLEVEVGDRSRRGLAVRPAPRVAPIPGFDGGSGLTAVRIPKDLRKHYGAPGDAGVLVSRVSADSPAARAGMKVGDVVVRVRGAAVQDPVTLDLAWIRPAADGAMRLQVVRTGKPVEVSIPRGTTVRAPRRPDAPVAVPLAPGDPDGDEDRVRMLREEIRALEARIEQLERELRDSREDE